MRGVVGVDFVEGMLRLGQAKLGALGERRVRLLAGDALALPFADASFGCVGSAFLLRNLADLRAGLAEMRRVTAPGRERRRARDHAADPPRLAPGIPPLLPPRRPAVGALIAGNREAYTYLPQSVDRFVTPGELARLMEAVGLRDVRVRRVGLGTVTIHVGRVGSRQLDHPRRARERRGLTRRTIAMPFLERDGARLYYETHGAGPALVFAHGLGGGHLSWWQQVPHFRDRYPCVTFDHRGFGLSTEASDRRGPDAYRRRPRRARRPPRAPDVGWWRSRWAAGPASATRSAIPSACAALVMACTTGRSTTRRRSRSSALTEPRSRRRGSPPSAASTPRPGSAWRRSSRPSTSSTARWTRSPTTSTRPRCRKKLIAMRTTPRAAVAALRAPLLCVIGEEDVVIPPAAVAVLASIVPGARLARVPEAGHSVYLERPAAFNRLVDEFLAGDAR